LQWIHTDPERCAKESPYGGTVVHGFLTLSLLPMLMAQSMSFSYAKLTVNYGLNKVRFPAPLLTNSQVRARFTLQAVEIVKEGTQLIWDISVESEGKDKPVCVAQMLMRCYG
jgi:acyl dehydratase